MSIRNWQISTTGDLIMVSGAALKQDPNTKQVTVSKVYSGTPSEEAGLKKDDEIVSVDGVEATSEDLTKLVAKIRGKEGTKVTLEIRRGEEADPFTVEVERKNVELPSVDSKLLDNGVGYIQVSEFQTNTASQFEDALDGLTNQGMKGLIVDLRANPGGLLTAVTEMVDRLLPAETVGKLPAGTVVYTKDKNGNIQTFGDDDGKQIDCPIVVLVDENSASASEVFTGALKDYGKATVVGKKSYGKGIVQSVLPFYDGSGMSLTVAKYYTPNGTCIHGIGIEPDVEVDMPDEYKDMYASMVEHDKDTQLQKAIEIIKEK